MFKISWDSPPGVEIPLHFDRTPQEAWDPLFKNGSPFNFTFEISSKLFIAKPLPVHALVPLEIS